MACGSSRRGYRTNLLIKKANREVGCWRFFLGVGVGLLCGAVVPPLLPACLCAGCRPLGGSPSPPPAARSGVGSAFGGSASGAFLLVFCVLRLLLFCGWGGVFCGWGGVFAGWAVLGVLFFFVSLSRSLVWCCAFLCFPFGRRGCPRFWLVSRVRVVRLLCSARAGLLFPFSFGAGRRGMPSLRFLALRPSRLLLVGGLVSRGCLRCFARCVGRLGWCARLRRPAFFVFLIFFNICRVCGRCRPFGGGASAASDGGKSTYKTEKLLVEIEI